jgi:hypothetical protein
VQIAARNPLDARVHRPCALFELELTPFHVNLLGRLLLLGQLREQPARAVLRGDQRQRADQKHHRQRDVDAQ